MTNVYDLFDKRIINICDSEFPFSVCAVLIDFEYPRCFIAQQDNKYFVFMECEVNEARVNWTVSPTDINEILDVNLGKKDVQSLFSKDLFEVSYEFDKEFGCICSANPKHEIKGSFYAKNFADMDEVFDIHHLQRTSLENNENSISIVFEEQNEGSTSLILKAINYLKDFMRNLRNPFDILKTNLSVQKGSTVITFSAENDLKSDCNLIPSLKHFSNDSFIELNNILSSNDSLTLLTNASSSKKVIQKYRGIVETLKKEDSLKPKIVVAMCDYKKPASYRMGVETAKENKKMFDEAFEMIKNKTNITENTIIVDGILMGIYLTSKGTFSFKEVNNQNRTFNGIIDAAIKNKMNEFIVNGALYTATISKIDSIIDGKVERTSYILRNLDYKNKIEKIEQLTLM